MSLQQDHKLFVNLSDKYINFINNIGSGEDKQGDKASVLFTQNCQKNFNGRWVAKDREAFVSDLLSVYKNYGSWQLIPMEIFATPENNSIILWMNILSKNMGKNTAIVILRYDSSYLIKEIIEVFSPIQTDYDFRNTNKVV